LHDRIDTEGFYTRRARSETTISYSACPRSPPSRCSRASTENQLSQTDRLHTGRSTADEHEDEHELVRSVLNADTSDKDEGQQQEVEADEDNDEDDGQAQQEVNSVAAALIAERVSNNYLSGKQHRSPRPAERQRLLSSPRRSIARPSHEEPGSDNDGDSDNELDNN
jgi:hypothetical protein